MRNDCDDGDDWDDVDGLGQCLFGRDCLVMSWHHCSDECYTAEMSYEQDKYYRELQLIEEYPVMNFVYGLRDWLLSGRSWNLKEWWENRKSPSDNFDIPF